MNIPNPFKLVHVKDIYAAFGECSLVLLFAWLPTLVLAFFYYAHNEKTVFENIQQSVKVKDLYLLSLTFLVPCVWIVNRDRENLPVFPGRLWTNVILGVMTTFYMIVVVLVDLEYVHHLKVDVFYNLGQVFAWLSLSAFFVLSILNNAYSRQAPSSEHALEKGRSRQADIKKALQANRRNS